MASKAPRPETIQTVTCYAGFRTGSNPLYVQAATRLGEELAKRNMQLVYGGGTAGVMGAIAVAVDSNGGKVIAISPKAMKKDVEPFIGKLIYVQSMHERKAQMMEMGDAFIALPGGIGTLEEFFETSTAGQLGMHRKPVGLLNIAGYYDSLEAQLNRMVEDGFLSEEMRNIVVVDSDPIVLLDKLIAHMPPVGYLNWDPEDI